MDIIIIIILGKGIETFNCFSQGTNKTITNITLPIDNNCLIVKEELLMENLCFMKHLEVIYFKIICKL